MLSQRERDELVRQMNDNPTTGAGAAMSAAAVVLFVAIAYFFDGAGEKPINHISDSAALSVKKGHREVAVAEPVIRPVAAEIGPEDVRKADRSKGDR